MSTRPPTQPPPPFDFAQTAYLFNWVSNASCLVAGNAKDLADFVYCSLVGPTGQVPNPFSGTILPRPLLVNLGSSLLGGDWVLKWGPGVFELEPGSKKAKADNTAFVVHSPSLDTYLVAIAGTDPKAILDWMLEDFRVGQEDCVDWATFDPLGPMPCPTKADPGKPQISLGTALGIWALGSQLTLSRGSPSPQNLATYLAGITPTAGSPNTQIIFTGHSLGGALSPTLAFWTRAAATKFTNNPIRVLPTAGATPGNETYQDAWDKAFPPADVGDTNENNLVTQWNRDVWAEQDLVPHAWQYVWTESQTGTQPFFLSNLPLDSLRSPIGDVVAAEPLRKLAMGAQAAGSAAFMQRAANTTSFAAQFPMQYYDKGDLKTLQQPTGPYVWVNDGKFFKDLGQIHVWSYGTSAFGIDFSCFTAIHPKYPNPAST